MFGQITDTNTWSQDLKVEGHPKNTGQMQKRKSVLDNAKLTTIS